MSFDRPQEKDKHECKAMLEAQLKQAEAEIVDNQFQSVQQDEEQIHNAEHGQAPQQNVDELGPRTANSWAFFKPKFNYNVLQNLQMVEEETKEQVVANTLVEMGEVSDLADQTIANVTVQDIQPGTRWFQNHRRLC